MILYRISININLSICYFVYMLICGDYSVIKSSINCSTPGQCSRIQVLYSLSGWWLSIRLKRVLEQFVYWVFAVGSAKINIMWLAVSD